MTNRSRLSTISSIQLLVDTIWGLWEVRGVFRCIITGLPEGWKISHEATVNGTFAVVDLIGGEVPGFTGFAQDDYHLAGGSSCVDTASLEDAPNTGIDRIFRPSGSGMDVGAYEYHVSPFSLLLFLNAFLNPEKKTTR